MHIDEVGGPLVSVGRLRITRLLGVLDLGHHGPSHAVDQDEPFPDSLHPGV